MLPYFAIIIIVIACAFFYDLRGYQRNKNIWINIVLIMLIMLAGFRYHIGTDSIYYEYQFEKFPTIFTLSPKSFIQYDYAPLYVIFTALLRTITHEFVIVQLVTSLLINYSVITFVKRHLGTEFIFTFVLFYFLTFYYSVNCETLRESIAISIFLWSIDFYKEKNWKKYYIYVFIAFLFHYGALLLFVLPLISIIKINKNNRVFLVAFVVGLIILLPYFHVTEALRLLLVSIGMANEFMGYIVSDQSQYALSLSSIVNWLILPLFFLYYQTKSKNSSKWTPLSFLLVAYLITVWLTTLVLYIFYRYNVYFGVIYYSLYAATVVDIAKKYFRKSVIAFVILLVPFFYGAYNNWTKVYVYEAWSDLKRIDLIDPYTSVFDKENVYDREKLYKDIGKY